LATTAHLGEELEDENDAVLVLIHRFRRTPKSLIRDILGNVYRVNDFGSMGMR
jgi:hypothetical protein